MRSCTRLVEVTEVLQLRREFNEHYVLEGEILIFFCLSCHTVHEGHTACQRPVAINLMESGLL
jgi:hypothetical protein